MTLERVPADEDQRRPYAATANVMAVLDRARRVNLPDRLTTDFLEIVGIPEISRGRVIEAIRFLGLTDANGRPTDALRSYAGAPDDELRNLLAGIISEAYADDLSRVHPAEDAQSRIIAAFRRYQPRSQTQRMVMLFLGLCRAAGMQVLDAPRERQMQANRATPRGRNGATPTSSTPRTVASPRRSVLVSAPPVPDQLGPVQSANLLFGVTVEDIGGLEPGEFKEVWDALGVIARARAKAAKDRSASRQTEEVAEEGE
jgi:hypothetical protein